METATEGLNLIKEATQAPSRATEANTYRYVQASISARSVHRIDVPS